MNARLAHLRRPLAALAAASAAALALTVLRPGPPPSVRVLAAARDLAGGTRLGAGDVRTVHLPPASVPSGSLHSRVAGRVLAAPMRRGEPLTDARLVGGDLLRGYAPGTVATPVRIADAGAVRLLHPGDRIDVLAPATTTPPEQDPTPPDRETTKTSTPRALPPPAQSTPPTLATSPPSEEQAASTAASPIHTRPRAPRSTRLTAHAKPIQHTPTTSTPPPQEANSFGPHKHPQESAAGRE
ncbi:flagellar biosynthesis protein FlgA [Actinomadura sp. J1-007]|uniref:SAF domain-containing protein n=1 Tax=Actinomadura sp. J1-007 TaxID=2661913 RepID=UPI0013264E56|nr:SAF domain-containing protein [Actinomadura sp. J1-007]MWK34120.1 flagellar biosynthesis protein FlgA [Actinomadura sp. J1-007]